MLALSCYFIRIAVLTSAVCFPSLPVRLETEARLHLTSGSLTSLWLESHDKGSKTETGRPRKNCLNCACVSQPGQRKKEEDTREDHRRRHHHPRHPRCHHRRLGFHSG